MRIADIRDAYPARRSPHFRADLDYSKSPEVVAFFDRGYRRRYRDCEIVRFPNDMRRQRAGIDVEIYKWTFATIKIEEKARRDDYGDIAIETVSDVDRAQPGWIAKPLECHYLTYAVVPARRIYWLDFQSLQALYFDNQSRWRRRYGELSSYNRGWVTRFIPVPVDELRGLPRFGMQVLPRVI